MISMSHSRRVLAVGVLVALATLPAGAHEGMWMPQQIAEVSRDLKAAGLQLNPATLGRLTGYPLGAVVIVGPCSGSFVSPQGLIATNHHCAYGSIQYNSTPARDLLQQGFFAHSLSEELPAGPGVHVYVTTAAQEVTEEIVDLKTALLRGKARDGAIEANEKALVAHCERDLGHRCRVSAYYGGLKFWLIKQLEIRDVRLVYAPPADVGKFGGETDNWMWPRHAGDFSFFRAYVGKDGKPADFNPKNVPYHPLVSLKLARTGLRPHDFVMVTGYPGRTNRYRLPSEVEFDFGWLYPELVRTDGEELAIITQKTRGRPRAQIAYASTVAAVSNTYKKYAGMLESYGRSGLLARKRAEWQQLKAWVDTNIDRRQRFGAALEAVGRLAAKRDAITRREYLMDLASPTMLDVARTLYTLANERAKSDDLARKPGFQARDWSRVQDGLVALQKRYDPAVDRAVTMHFLLEYLKQPAQEQDRAFNSALGLTPRMGEIALGAQLDRLYRRSQLGNAAVRLAWLSRAVDDFGRTDDPFIRAAVALHADDEAREHRDEALEGDLQQAYSGYMQALIAFKESRGQPVYPDANGTLRITFGKIEGRIPGREDGTAWTPFTTVRGLLAKDRGTGEFNVPAAERTAIQARRFDGYYDPGLGSVPVDFLATLDITSGNSGSPVLNDRGELVGLAFDGTLDSIISDWDFNSRMVRTIGVNAQYILWYMKVIDHADRLLRETNVGEVGVACSMAAAGSRRSWRRQRAGRACRRDRDGAQPGYDLRSDRWAGADSLHRAQRVRGGQGCQCRTNSAA